ncbi:MAG TPA: hypothetical protein VGC97_16880 [Pyrinomonadaceae bacterium]|jgi:BASS family bile acid:Na+ symporter
MSLLFIIGIGVKLSLFLTLLGYGLQATLDDVLYLFRRPGQLVRALLSINVIMAIFVALLIVIFDFNPVIEIALAALAISPVPPLLPNKALKSGGEKSFTYGLLAAVSLLSILTIPLILKIFEAIFEKRGEFSEMAVITTILISVIVPLVIGMVIRYFAPAFSERVAGALGKFAMILLIVTFLPILVGLLPLMWSLIGNGTLPAIVAFALVGITVGHFLGGPDPQERTVLALATSSRHPAIAITLASAGVAEKDAKLAAAAIVLYLLVSAIVATPYLAWLKDHDREKPAKNEESAMNFQDKEPPGAQISAQKKFDEKQKKA